MKKLLNVSPFLLLLIPVFMMMVLGFATTHTNKVENVEVAFKTAPSTIVPVIKVKL